MKTSLVTPQYSELLKKVRETIALGERRARRAVEREKVRTAWQTGKLIHKHILLNQDRAGYGKKVIARLARDLGMSSRSVFYMLEFAKEYPIVRTFAQLSWSHYQVLLGVNDVKKRHLIERQAEKESWTIAKLRSRVRSENKLSKKAKKFKKIEPGILNVYRKRILNGKSLIDLGFSTYLRKKDIKKKIKIVKDRNFTYQAEVERVVDGDTLWCLVDLGLGVKVREKLRLRGINAEEVGTRQGDRAKRYLARKLPLKTQILITTSKTDKYDRYLVDIWQGEIYLNQLLVIKGYARPV